MFSSLQAHSLSQDVPACTFLMLSERVTLNKPSSPSSRYGQRAFLMETQHI